MRGSLAIEQVILLILALIVLAAVVMLLFGTYKPSQQGLDLEAAKNNACQTYVSIGCEGDGSTIKVNYDANKDKIINSNDNLKDLCTNYFGTTCTNVCRCGV